MGIINWLVAGAIVLWRREAWPLALAAILFDPPGYVAVSDVPEARRLIDYYYDYYVSKGYPPGLVEKAIEWAKHLAEAMTNRLDLPDEEKKRVLLAMLKFYLEKAEDWMRGLIELVAPPKLPRELALPQRAEHLVAAAARAR